LGGRTLRLGWVQGNECFGQKKKLGAKRYDIGQGRLGKLPLGKLHIWEVATWKNTGVPEKTVQ